MRTLMVLALAAAALAAQAAPAPPLLVTTSGPVRGSWAQGLAVFRGIPYAAAPTGALRFQPPRPPAPWTAALVATANPPACPQLQNAQGLPAISEDCLRLNVWTPALDHARRPVMVWIHGGEFAEGGNYVHAYDGAALARAGNLVVVDVQYRLGALGFLELAEIGGKDYAASGNLGLLDQIAALRWVRTNAGALGGDRGNITVFGESAGGSSIANLLAAPAARGLFQKAILESPATPGEYTGMARADQIARALMQLAGVSTVAELQRLPLDTLLSAQKKLGDYYNPLTEFCAVNDGLFTPQPVLRMLLEGSAAEVPVLIGTNGDELKSSRASAPAEAPFIAALARVFGGRAALVAHTYEHDFGSVAAAEDQFSGDESFRIPAIQQAEALSRTQPVWMYLFTYDAPPNGPEHTAEIRFVFGNLPASWPNAAANQRVSQAMQTAWIAFARTGNPGWPRYDAKRRQTMEFGATPQDVSDPRGAERKLWAGVRFNGMH
ncbi:MAG: carboxylesterase/lipase family protein [Terriglobales bacterium]